MTSLVAAFVKKGITLGSNSRPNSHPSHMNLSQAEQKIVKSQSSWRSWTKSATNYFRRSLRMSGCNKLLSFVICHRTIPPFLRTWPAHPATLAFAFHTAIAITRPHQRSASSWSDLLHLYFHMVPSFRLHLPVSKVNIKAHHHPPASNREGTPTLQRHTRSSKSLTVTRISPPSLPPRLVMPWVKVCINLFTAA